ncbi:DUF4239 domain-containing protein [Xanthobacteraceae bacterium Astr-EGSB]|uniref:bestrophin-like domain n=1 Tax=Astrobacterium formosum TaxID=3069710 RepID=UPI0027B46533|nr:DUF4239 domain-containing protein [Xanthobacteraceae bacterium Astr-EGSB]
MLDYLYNIVPLVPDVVVLLVCGAVFGVLGLLISKAAYFLWFSHWKTPTSHEDKIADTVHASLLGIIAFFLALVTTSDFGSFNKADSLATTEALQVSRIDRELEGLGELGLEGRRVLARYVAHVVEDEWPRLAGRPQSLSPLAKRDLEQLWREIRAVQKRLGPEMGSLRSDLSSLVASVEEARIGRLSASISAVPDVFWIMMMTFFVAASALSGRKVIKGHGMQINMLYMCAFGLIVGINIIIDNPFDGQTSVKPDRIVRALTIDPALPAADGRAQ